MKVLSVVGARPQFIKAAPVSRLLRRCHHEVLLHTGQHYDERMSDLFFRQLGIPEPDHNLGVGSGSHAVQTGHMLIGVERVALEERPDWVLVYGDTNSTLAAALAAAKLRIPLAHVEAGLRSFDRAMPEEINRVLTDHASDLSFCPTRAAVRNLAAEGITRGVHMVGDVMFDAFQQHLAVAERSATVLDDLGLRGRRYLLVTVHRAENTNDTSRLLSILRGLEAGGELVVFPIHPRTRSVLAGLGWPGAPNVCVIDPVGYLEMLALERGAAMILTDSGGVQKEAYFLGVPCVTLRDNTEWVETVEAGWNRLVGADSEAIAEAVRAFRPSGCLPPHYGDGHAAERIVAVLSGQGSGHPSLQVGP